MPQLQKVLRPVLWILTSLLFFGCADFGQKFDRFKHQMSKKSDLPEPIATSSDEMPTDAALVAKAIQQWMTGRPQIQNVSFEGSASAAVAPSWFAEQGFVGTGGQLFLYNDKPQDPSEKHVTGRLEFEGPWGRRTLVLYETRYRMRGQSAAIEDLRIEPMYSNAPEPLLFVVPMEDVFKFGDRYPRTYGGLLQFVGEHAIDANAPMVVPMEKRSYVVFIIFLDQVSPSAKLEVKISNKRDDLHGYKKATQYIDFDGWSVAFLPVQFTLFGNTKSPPLYVKAVFTPGEDVGFLRRSPRRVGVFTVSGSPPP